MRPLEPELHELDLWLASAKISSNFIQPRELLASCLEHIQERESAVGAFTSLDIEFANSQLNQLSTRNLKNPLFGIPIGIKDIINTVDFPTTMGSSIYTDYFPQRDAAIVAQCKNAGAIIPGKTESTEFAFFAPGLTKNPHNLDHTPGGSSMGSAAAVADFMLPYAIGSQTAGSVIRPAAYCGVVGYKASHGAFSLEGICGLAQSLDSLGFFVRNPKDLFLIRNGLLNTKIPAPDHLLRKPQRIGLVKTPHWKLAEPYQRNILYNSANKLKNAAPCEIIEIEIEPNDGSITEAQAAIMAFEASRSLSREFFNHRDLLSPQIQQLIQDGNEISYDTYQEAKNISYSAQKSLQKIFGEFDLLMTLSATGEAPKGLDKTGDPIFNRMWTLLKVPCISLPVGTGPNRLPTAIQLVGAFDQDDALIAHSSWIFENL